MASALGDCCRRFVEVNERTRTPFHATALATAAILGLALSLHIVTLAEWTSRIISIFAIVR